MGGDWQQRRSLGFFLSSMQKPPECSELERNMLCLTPVLKVPPSCQVETRKETATPGGKIVLSLRPRNGLGLGW